MRSLERRPLNIWALAFPVVLFLCLLPLAACGSSSGSQLSGTSAPGAAGTANTDSLSDSASTESTVKSKLSRADWVGEYRFIRGDFVYRLMADGTCITGGYNRTGSADGEFQEEGGVNRSTGWTYDGNSVTVRFVTGEPDTLKYKNGKYLSFCGDLEDLPPSEMTREPLP